MKLVQFSNKRGSDVKDLGMVVSCSPTVGKIRLTPDVVKAMEVSAGDYVAIAGDAETGKNYIFKGTKTEKVQVGNKLSESGHYLEFGSTNAWEEIGGKKTHIISFDVSETPVEDGDMKYFELTNPTEKEVKKREKKEVTADEVKGNTADEVAEDTKEAVAEEIVVEAEEGFSLE